MKYLGQGGHSHGGLCGHGQHGEDAQRDAGRHGVHRQPEGHPGQHDDHDAGDVDGDHVVTQVTLQVKVHRDAREVV